MVDKKQ